MFFSFTGDAAVGAAVVVVTGEVVIGPAAVLDDDDAGAGVVVVVAVDVTVDVGVDCARAKKTLPRAASLHRVDVRSMPLTFDDERTPARGAITEDQVIVSETASSRATTRDRGPRMIEPAIFIQYCMYPGPTSRAKCVHTNGVTTLLLDFGKIFFDENIACFESKRSGERCLETFPPR
mgnify:CR=1 FL=1